MDDDVEREARAEDVGAERAVLVGLVARLLQALEPEGELAPAEDEGLLGADRVGRDRRPLDDLVRVALDEQVVLEGRRLALVAVHDEVASSGPGAASTTCGPPGSRRRRGRAGSPC